jgi:hypothetical protein
MHTSPSHRRVAAYIAPIVVILFTYVPIVASAASLYLDPDRGMYGPGDTFILNVRLNTDGECVNAADVTLTYPPESMRAVDFGKGGSILSLWVNEPAIDTAKGTITFAGGVPGGYCGRIQGDPSLTNTLGKVVFSVTNAGAGKADIAIARTSSLYLNDGLGTKITPEIGKTTIQLLPGATLNENPWLRQVGDDKVPPESFDVLINSVYGVFGGRYFAVFSTVDKQSGVDHYEMVINGAWQRVTSPHVIDESTLRGGVEVRAIDKAGNVRLGTYVASAVPKQQAIPNDYMALLVILALFVIVLVARHFLNKKNETNTIDLRS